MAAWFVQQLFLSFFLFFIFIFYFFHFNQDIYYYNYKELLKKKIITMF